MSVFILFYFTNAIFILKKEVITNETVNNDLKNVQNLKNLKYNLLENSENILSEHSNDPDLQFFLNIQNLNTPCILSEELRIFGAMIR